MARVSTKKAVRRDNATGRNVSEMRKTAVKNQQKRSSPAAQRPELREEASRLVKRAKNGRFQKGSSGSKIMRLNNESHLAYIRRVAREHTDVAVNTLAEIAGDAKCNPGARVKAAVAILDRGYGKPTQIVETIASNRALHEIPTSELVEMIQEDQQRRADRQEAAALPEPEIIAADGHDAS